MRKIVWLTSLVSHLHIPRTVRWGTYPLVSMLTLWIPVVGLAMPLLGGFCVLSLGWQKSTWWKVVLWHGILAVVGWGMWEPLWMRVSVVGVQLWLLGFYAMYGVCSRNHSPKTEMGSFLGTAAISIFVVWGFVALDGYLWNGVVENSVAGLIAAEVEQVRKALLTHQISFFELPSSMQLLLQKGAAAWAGVVVKQIPLGVVGLWIFLAFWYWNWYDTKIGKTAFYHRYQLPDVVLVAVVVWLTMLSISTLPFWGHATEILLFDLSSMGLWTTLCVYGVEGVSILLRTKFPIRRFWIVFFLIALAFFSVQWAALGLMAFGLLAQIRRFLPGSR